MKHRKQSSVVKQQLAFNEKVHFNQHYNSENSNQKRIIVKDFINQNYTKEKKNHDKQDSHKQGVIKLPVFHCFIFFIVQIKMISLPDIILTQIMQIWRIN